MTTTVKIINENNNEATYFIDSLVNGKCLVAGLSYMAKIEREGTFIIKFDSTIHHLYTHISNDYDYIIQSKDSTINVEEKYSHHRPYNDNYIHTQHAFCTGRVFQNVPYYTNISEAQKMCNDIKTCLCIDNLTVRIHTNETSYRLINSNGINKDPGVVTNMELNGYCSPSPCYGDTCSMPCQAWVKKPS